LVGLSPSIPCQLCDAPAEPAVIQPNSSDPRETEAFSRREVADRARAVRGDGETAARGSRKPLRLSEEITGLIALLGQRSVRLRELLAVLQARAYTLLVLLLALPFCTPVPLVGVSTPFGAVIALVGFRLALGQKPWLPQRLLDTTLPSGFFARVLGAAKWLVRALEALLRPRFSEWVETRVFRHGYGAIIFVCGLLLMLPLPIPLTNGLPALTIVLLAGAMLERDGISMAIGLVTFLLTLALFGLLLWGGAEAAGWLKAWFSRLGAPESGG
jgi:hypothetical protein